MGISFNLSFRCEQRQEKKLELKQELVVTFWCVVCHGDNRESALIPIRAGSKHLKAVKKLGYDIERATPEEIVNRSFGIILFGIDDSFLKSIWNHIIPFWEPLKEHMNRENRCKILETYGIK
jgi:hypothetical protein